MRVLHLTIKKKWFDMIASGEKKEEYREIKPYWIRRLLIDAETTNQEADYEWFIQNIKTDNVSFNFQEYDYIHFKNGYNKPRAMNVEFKGISIDTGKPAWGAKPKKEYFVIKLGEIII